LADLSAVTGAVSNAGVVIDEIALRRPTLDDAFLTFTGQPADSGLAEAHLEEVAR
jgi:hypothetical protein